MPSVIFTILVSLASIIFIGGSATRGPKGVYTVPDATGLRWDARRATLRDDADAEGSSDRMALFTIFLTLITLPMTVIINR